MAKGGVEVIGAARFSRTARAAARDIREMHPGDAGRVVASRARAGAPKRTGRLAASVTAGTDGGDVVVSSRLVYAPVIHNGWPGHNISANPFLTRGLENSRAEVERIYAAEAQDALGKVKGA
jgi:phage gpG-like protein